MEIKVKKAYLVTGWATEIITGVAFNIKLNDFGVSDKSYFSKDKGETFAKHYMREVFYNLPDAENQLKEERKSVKAYYEKQIQEANDRIKGL